MQTTPGSFFGTGPVNTGTYLYADPTAVLQGVWAQDQQVQATDFTYLVRNATTCVNGDVLKLTAVGNTFTVYKNGGQVLQGTDATFQKGSPGFGFYNSIDTNRSGFGLSNFSASNVSRRRLSCKSAG